MDPNDLCIACLNGKYPTHYGEIRAGESRERWMKDTGKI
jgi:hypothetical protein